jgi:ATP-dependent DNA helicase RecG
MGKAIFTDLTEDEVAYLYTLLREEVTNYDCGSLCKDDNGGVPFCCVTENAVPLLYKKEFELLKTRFSQKTIALLHGQMKGDEKKKVMDLFRRAEAAMLVATPVIEVGIDVPNAALMIIMNPERFGLAQLHQLRGRVGRGDAPSECLLVMEDGQEAHERLSSFCAISDGFKLAEEDLRLRGPGEFLGEAQHGLPFFKVGNLALDQLLLSRAREAARTLVQGEIALTMKEFASLNKSLVAKLGHKLQLSNVG